MNGNDTVDFQIMPEGSIVGPGFHDGNATGIVFVDGCFVITAANYRGELYELKLLRPSVIAVNDFWESNLISDVFLWELDRAPEIFLRRLFLRRLPSDLTAVELSAELRKRGSRKVFALESSYGAEITAGCDDLQITSVGRNKLL
jgi:hypothetical protein